MDISYAAAKASKIKEPKVAARITSWFGDTESDTSSSNLEEDEIGRNNIERKGIK